MPISQIPAPSTGGEDTAFATAIPVVGTTYENVNNFDEGIYTISVNPTSSDAFITLVSATTVLVNASTTSGTVGVTLSSTATKAYITLGAGATAGAIVTIAKTAGALTSTDIGNGTLDTINTTGTYNQTGLMGVLLVGGGAAGGRGAVGSPATGGRAGFINLNFVVTNTAQTVTVGAKGVAQVTNNDAITDANNSSFGNLVTATSASNFWTNGNGGNGGGFYAGNGGNASGVFRSFNGASTTGGGGGGTGQYATVAFGAGSGSGIGTGGNGGTGGTGGGATNRNPTTVANAASGKGAGGGGGAYNGNSHPNAVGRYGKDGSDGVVYVLRGF